ncbi:MAG: hypothetical protein IT447_05610 [Phycisphaerales bacterium]|nr:hypothetical protein [Phycisphaerales bacterium]
MRTPVKHLALVLATSATCLFGTLVTGCDQLDSAVGISDRSVDNTISEAELQRLAGGDGWIATLQKAASEKGASPAQRARANGLLADAEFNQARQHLAKARSLRLEVDRLFWSISDLTQQVQSNSALIDGFRKLEPSEARKQIAAQVALAQGGPDQPAWFKHDNTPLPTLSYIKQEISRLQGEIAGLQDKIKELTGQRSKALEQAEAANAKSEQLKGQESVDAYKQGADQRKNASELATQIDHANADIAARNRDLEVALGQEAVLNDTLKQYQAQLKQVDDGWNIAQAKIQDLTQLSRQIVQGNADNSAGSIQNQAARLVELSKNVQTELDAAQQLLASTATHFDAAASAAQDLNRDLSAKMRDPAAAAAPERAAWKQLLEAFQPSGFKLRQAEAQQTLGVLHTEQANQLAQFVQVRDALKTAVDKAGIPMPTELADADLASRLQTARDDAQKGYQSADELLLNIANTDSNQDRKNAALVQRMLTQYGWYQLERNAGNKEAAQQHLAEAVNVAKAAAEAKAPLPSLPPELATIAVVAAPTPGTPGTPGPTPQNPPTAQ